MKPKRRVFNERSPFITLRALVLSVTILASIRELPGAQRPSAVTIKVDTQLVVETVVAKDKDGKNIDGLTEKDFIVTEDGVPQAISVFQFQRLEDTPATTSAAAVAVRHIHADAPRTPAQIIPPHQGDPQYRNRRLLVLFFDLASMPVPDQLRAFEAADKFIRTRMKPPDLLALMVFDSKGVVKVLHDFTDERNQLLDALEMHLYDSGGETAQMGGAFGQDNREFNLFNSDRRLAALQTAVNILKPVDGQKALVYFASGLQVNALYNQAQLSATINAAIRANVTFFPVDARGLVASPPLGDATQMSPGGIDMYSGAAAMASMAKFQGSQDTLFALARDTGGKALLDNNDLAAGIVQAEQAITSYYIIGYYPAKSALDGKFRRIRITLKEVPSAKLEFRQGYFAAKTFGKFTTSDKERQLEEALMLGDPITDLTLAMEVNYFLRTRTEYFVPVTVKIPGSELVHTTGSAGSKHTLIDFIGEVKDSTGKTMQNLRDHVDLKVNYGATGESPRRAVQYETAFILPPGRYVIKVLARDGGTGRIGTYQAAFVVPDLGDEKRCIPISSVVLSSQRVEVRRALYRKSGPVGQSANPLIIDGQELVPSVTRVFSKSRPMYVYLQAYQSGSNATHPLVAFVSFYHGETRAFQTSLMQFVDTLDTKSGTLPLEFGLSLSELPPGEYNFQATVLDPVEQKVTFWQAPVMLVP